MCFEVSAYRMQTGIKYTTKRRVIALEEIVNRRNLCFSRHADELPCNLLRSEGDHSKDTCTQDYDDKQSVGRAPCITESMHELTRGMDWICSFCYGDVPQWNEVRFADGYIRMYAALNMSPVYYVKNARRDRTFCFPLWILSAINYQLATFKFQIISVNSISLVISLSMV